MKPEVILSLGTIVARSCIGDTWTETWSALLRGTRNFEMPQSQFPDWPAGPPVGIIRDPSFTRNTYLARQSSLVRCVVPQLRADIARLRRKTPTLRARLLYATSHGDPSLTTTAAESSTYAPDVRNRLIIDDETLAVREIDPTAGAICLHGACASALVAVTHAWLGIRLGLFDVAAIVSADCVSRVAYVGFNNVGAMSRQGCTPFDRHRDGMTASEGVVGFLMARAPIIAEQDDAITVHAATYNCDGQGIVDPNEDGLMTAIGESLETAGKTPNDIDFVYWHGTGTRKNDETESSAAAQIWASALPPPGTSTKGSLGHTMGAASAFNVAAACNTIATGLLPPTAGLAEPEFSRMNLAQSTPVRGKFALGLCVAMGFGGINAAIVLGR